MSKTNPNKYGVVIGANKDTVTEARLAIKEILASVNDQSTKVAALETLKNICQVSNTNISNATITVK